MSQDYQQPPAKGGMSVVMIVLIVVGVLFLGCAGFCGVSGYLASVTVRQGAQAISQALELIAPSLTAQIQIDSNEEVKAKLGEDLEYGDPKRVGDAAGELNTADTTFTMTVKAKGGGNGGVATVHAAQVDGLWKVDKIEILCDDGTVINVPPPEGETPPSLDFGTGLDPDPTSDPAPTDGN